jgi:23S rRNA pseudouridine1911/1915/1917 synthase
VLFTVSAADARQRLDSFVSEKAGITRSRAKHLVDKGLVRVNGAPEKAGCRLGENDTVEVTLPRAGPQGLLPEDIPVRVLYSDPDLVVVDKPPGMVVYPAAGHSTGTLMNALAFRFRNMASVGGPLRPGVVHRLDKDTSGTMVVALSDRAYYRLVETFRQREVRRSYLALVYGALKKDEGEFTLSIGRSASDRKKMSTRTRRGKEAKTMWKVERRLAGATLVSARLATGRTHQIRVHFASAGHPVLGDRVYGKKTSLLIKGKQVSFPRQMLHARLLGFAHPVTGEYLEFVAPMPVDMREAVDDISRI